MNELPEKSVLRISRALYWFHHAILSQNALDRYTSLWIGLESLNPLLMTHYKPVSEATKKGTTLVGVKLFVDELFPKTPMWKRIRDLRVGTVHGFKRFSEIMPKAIRLVPILESIFVRALDKILNIEERVLLEPVSLDHPNPVYATAKAQIEGPDLGIIDAAIEPDVCASFDHTLTENIGIRTEHQKVNSTFTFSIDERFKFGKFKIEVHTMEHIAKRVDVIRKR